jgi:hypothetical protein
MSRRSSEKKENLWIKISIGITISSVILGLCLTYVFYRKAKLTENNYMEDHPDIKHDHLG